MRAFAIRFAAFAMFALVLILVMTLADGRGGLSWQAAAVMVVITGALGAVAGYAGDYRRWEGASFGGSDDRPWREILLGSREERLRKSRERVFRNSARAGFVTLGVGLLWLGLGLDSDARIPLEFAAAAAFVWIGIGQLWAGWRRWRAGGEFNHPSEVPPEPDA